MYGHNSALDAKVSTQKLRTVNQERPKYAIYFGHTSLFRLKDELLVVQGRIPRNTGKHQIPDTKYGISAAAAEFGLLAVVGMSKSAGANGSPLFRHPYSRLIISQAGRRVLPRGSPLTLALVPDFLFRFLMLPPPVHCWCKSPAFNTNLPISAAVQGISASGQRDKRTTASRFPKSKQHLSLELGLWAKNTFDLCQLWKF